MATELKVPPVGESITEVTLAKWIKNDGEFVEMDETVCELESDKATFELNAESSGILKTKVKEGETIEIGTVIGMIEENGKSSPDVAGEAKKEKPEEPRKATEKNPQEDKLEKTGNILEMKVPAVGESITEVTISSWIKNDGEHVDLDEVIAEIDSDKATFELTAEASGILHHVAREGDTLEIDALICRIEEVSSETVEKKEGTEKPDGERGRGISPETYAEGHPSPAAAKMMAEKGLQPEDIQGTGPGGRIIKEDVEKAGKRVSQPEKKEVKK